MWEPIYAEAPGDKLFQLRDPTAWVDKTEQTFELDVQGPDGLFS
jgi:hypothetical protein